MILQLLAWTLPINDLGEITGGYLVNACNGEKVGVGAIGLAMIAL